MGGPGALALRVPDTTDPPMWVVSDPMRPGIIALTGPCHVVTSGLWH